MDDDIIKYKFILLGDTGVGKTNIVSRIINDDFSMVTQSTISIEFGKKLINLNGKNYIIQIFDTAGQEKYRAITKSYIKGAKGVFIVYDITKTNSFNNIDNWIDDVKQNNSDDCVIEIIGNKIDLVDQREVSFEEGKKKAEKYNSLFIETSAYNNSNINEALNILLEDVIKCHQKNNSITFNDMLGDSSIKRENTKNITNINNNNTKKKKKCCKR